MLFSILAIASWALMTSFASDPWHNLRGPFVLVAISDSGPFSNFEFQISPDGDNPQDYLVKLTPGNGTKFSLRDGVLHVTGGGVGVLVPLPESLNNQLKFSKSKITGTGGFLLVETGYDIQRTLWPLEASASWCAMRPHGSQAEWTVNVHPGPFFPEESTDCLLFSVSVKKPTSE